MSGTREQRRNGAAFQWADDVQKLAEGDTIKGGFRLCRCEQLLCVRVDRQLTSTLGGHASGEINNITCAFILWRLEFRN